MYVYYKSLCTFEVCDRNIDHQRGETDPHQEEWSNKAQRPAKSHKDRTEMMMAPSNLTGLQEEVGESRRREDGRRDHELVGGCSKGDPQDKQA